MHIKDLTTDTDNVSQILVPPCVCLTVLCSNDNVAIDAARMLRGAGLCNSRVSVRPSVRPPVCPSMEAGYTWFAQFLENINRVSTLTVIVASKFWA